MSSRARDRLLLGHLTQRGEGIAMTDDQGSLPPIGNPARRALASFGVTRLEQLQQHRAEDLLALHGVGPKAISRLRSALADHDMSFLGEDSAR